MTPADLRVALLYDDDAYQETLRKQPGGKATGPMGLMGRQVAGKEFLDAYLTHGRWNELVALVRNQPSAASIQDLWKTHPATQSTNRRLKVVTDQNFHKDFFPKSPANVLHIPCPPEVRYVWARQHAGPASFALSGLTHTICSESVVQAVCNFVTAPFEPYDVLFCISRAALKMVRDVAGVYADYLADRHGGKPALRLRLENVPLGVNTEKYRPATADEKSAQRKHFGIADDELVVLFVGRLSFHAKVHPFPIYEGVSRAARATGKKVHLIMSGWAANEYIHKAFADGAKAFAPGVRVSIVDGTKPEYRLAVWQAADIFSSLTDNIQETLSQVIIEGMSCGLPVVATNWDGCRDQVIEGESGFLVPTYMIRDGTADATSRLLVGEINYDYFLAECNQAVAVDVEAAAAAFARLLSDAGLRRQMGMAGRQRILDHFTWAKVVRAYEDIWQEQEIERQKHFVQAQGAQRSFPTPACYPSPEISFASYPMKILEAEDRVVSAADAEQRLEVVLKHPLTNYSPAMRVTDPALLRRIIAAAKSAVVIGELDKIFKEANVVHGVGRATTAWLMKYAVLTLSPTDHDAQGDELASELDRRLQEHYANPAGAVAWSDLKIERRPSQ